MINFSGIDSYAAIGIQKDQLIDLLNDMCRDHCYICSHSINKHSGDSILYNKNIIHTKCLVDFHSYIAVEALDSYTREVPDYHTYGLSLDFLQHSHWNGHYSTMEIANGFRKYLKHGSEVVDLQCVKMEDHLSMATRFDIRIRVREGCMFCGHPTRLLLPPLMLTAHDTYIDNMSIARADKLVATVDNKYIFHNSCLNEFITYTERFIK